MRAGTTRQGCRSARQVDLSTRLYIRSPEAGTTCGPHAVIKVTGRALVPGGCPAAGPGLQGSFGLWRGVDAPGGGGGLGAVGDIELGQDVGDVHADRFLADEQLLGDTPVAEPVGEKREYLPFSFGEVARRAGLRGGLAGQGDSR